MTKLFRPLILCLVTCGLLLGGNAVARADDPGSEFPPANKEPVTPPVGPKDAPAAFRKPLMAMDVNKDGRISKAEWKGPAEVFARIDVNQDGFVDAQDAPSAKGKPAPAAAKPEEAAPAANDAPWSPPAVTPGAGSALGSLPPPRVVRRRGSLPARRPTTANRAPTGTPAPPRAPLRDLPSVRDVPARTNPPLPPIDNTTGRTPSAPSAGTFAAATTAAGVGGSRVIGIAKTHNVPLERVDGQPQDLALQFDVDYEVRNQANRDVQVAIWFARADGTGLVTSSMRQYADARGKVTLQTRSARVAGTSARYNAVLRIPYRAFPIKAGESSYDVKARVQILRSEAAGKVTVLCEGTTTFRVYGFEETAEEMKPEDAKPADSPAVANEDGTITDGR